MKPITKKKAITRELLEEHLGPQRKIRRTITGAWWIELQSGASVKITRKRINFGKYREIANRTGIDEEIFQEEVGTILSLGDEVWGGIGVYGGASQEDCATFLEKVEAAGIDTGDQGMVLRHFGPEATFKCRRIGWEVRYPDGSGVKVSGGAIEEVVGGGDVFRSALRLISQIKQLLPEKGVVVRGKPELLVMGVEHGKAIDVEVIPEDPLKVFCVATAVAMQIICMALASIWLNWWEAILAGYFSGIGLCMIGGRVFWKQLQAAARKRGLRFKGIAHTTSDANRKASIDDAKSGGML